MERKNTVGLRSNRTFAYDRTLVVPHRHPHGAPVAIVSKPPEPAPKPTPAPVKVHQPSEPKLRTSDHVYFDMKPAQKPVKPVSNVRETPKQEVQQPIRAMYSPMKKADLASRLPVEPILHHGQPQRILPKQAFAKQYLLYGMAVVVFVIGLGASIQGWLANQAVTTQASVLSQHTTRGGDAEQPSEDPPQSTGGYSVAPELPRMISIPSIQVNARILHLGVDDKNVLKSPNNIFDTAWYQSSARPTDTKGAMLIDGHVSGPTKHGVFYDIKKLKKGDDIVVERGDGQKIHFEVVEVMTTLAEEVNMSALLRSIDESKLGLNLITCGGTFNAETNTFESRTQVFAVKKSL